MTKDEEKDEEKTEEFNAFFIPVFNSKTSLLIWKTGIGIRMKTS